MNRTDVSRRVPLRRKVLYSAILLVMIAVTAEVFARFLYHSVSVYRRYQWLVGTHLVDLQYSDFIHRQERIRDVRKRLGMERGRSHALFRWTYNPTFGIDDDEMDLHIHINSYGLRGPEFPESKPPDEIRVLCLGGSTTAGEEVVYEETYPAQLETCLRRRIPGRRIRVINGGVPSYSEKDSFLFYALRLYRCQPDFVTIYHGINGLAEHSGEGIEVSPKQNYNGELLAPFVYEGDASRMKVRHWVTALLRNSLCFTLLHDQYQRLKAAPAPQITSPNPAGIERFRACTRALVQQVMANHAIPVPMTFALSYPGKFEAKNRDKIAASFHVYLEPSGIPLDVGCQIMELQNQTLKELCREVGVPLCDVAAAVPADERYFVDSCHLTRAGNRRIAETLAETLVPMIRESYANPARKDGPRLPRH